MNCREQTERRKYVRYPFREDILIDGSRQAYSQNICEAGMFISTLHPVEKGRIITLTIASLVTVRAVVKNFQSGIGMGVEFIEVTHDQAEAIKQLIEDIRLGAPEN